jgi:hypothetical protein
MAKIRLNVVSFLGSIFAVSDEQGKDIVDEVKGLLMSGASEVEIDFAGVKGSCSHFLCWIAGILEQESKVTIASIDDYELGKLNRLRELYRKSVQTPVR